MLLQAEEEDDSMTEEQKAAERAKPVSSTPVPGTPWSVAFIISLWKDMSLKRLKQMWEGQASLQYARTRHAMVSSIYHQLMKRYIIKKIKTNVRGPS